MRRRRVLATLASAVLAAGCTEGEPENGTPDDDDPDERVEIESHELVRYDEGTDDESVAVEGEVRINESGLEHIELEARFFDAEEEQLDITNERLEEFDVGVQPFAIQYPGFGEAARAVQGYQIAVASVVELP